MPPVDPVSLVTSFTGFVFKNYRKIQGFGGTRADLLTELCDEYKDAKMYLIEFFSDDEVFKLLEQLQKGSGKDFKTLIEKFSSYCEEKGIQIDTETILKNTKHNLESLQAETNFENIAIEYLQAIHDSVKDMTKKIEAMTDSGKFSKTPDDYISSYISALKSKLKPAPDNTFTMSFMVKDEVLPISELKSIIKTEQKVILHGTAGGGKTRVVTDLASSLIDEGLVPVVIELGDDWGDPLSEELDMIPDDVDKRMDVLLKAAKGSINVDSLSGIDKVKYIIIDGLNEISAGEYGESTTRTILNVVGEYCRNHSKTYVVVTDRKSTRSHVSLWCMASLQELSEEEVKKQIDGHFVNGTFDELNDKDKSLLAIPFFLKFSIESDSPSLGSKSEALRKFFMERLHFDDDELNKLSAAAFKAYGKFGSRSFDTEEFQSWAGPDLFNRLVNDVAITKHNGKASFVHQLYHDYLVSRHLALKEDWTLTDFDIASLKSNSLDTITMAMEQITEKQKVDRFLEKVYDWNWSVALTCTASATKMGAEGPSIEIVTMMLCIAAEKMFDQVIGTSNDAKDRLTEFGDEWAQKLSMMKTIDEIIAEVKATDSSDELFKSWKELFAKNKGDNVDDDEILMIGKENSFTGWMTANVLKRLQLSDKQQRDLRIAYNFLLSNSQHNNTVRWRIIHALGAFASSDNSKLLFKALDDDPYLWTKYGAVRSLVEMASVSDEHLDDIVAGLLERVPNLDVKVLGEIGRSALRENPPERWKEKILPLLEKCKEAKEDADHKEEWTKLIEGFKGQ